MLITADEGKRGGRTIGIKRIADEALKECPGVTNVLVLKRTGGDVHWVEGRDRWWHDEVVKVPSYRDPTSVNAEHPLFILYVRLHAVPSTRGY